MSRARGILEIARITRLPTAARVCAGVVSMAGKAIPVVDLRRRFGLPDVAQ